MRPLYTLLLGALLLGPSSARATVHTGSFDTTIAFMDTTRKLSCYVPTKYSDTNKYRLMVCLHGLGDNSANYRNSLISALGWATDFPNTIFVCPEAATTSADYYYTNVSDSGGQFIVDTCIRFAMSKYHIDSSDVILQGFSLGGRAALRYGLDHYAKFKGLLLNTPAIQGVKNALNEQPSYLYTYTNSSHIPIYITHGESDAIYEPPIDSALKLMILSDGIVRYVDVPNMAHSIPAFSQMSDILKFFDTQARPGAALEVVELDAPERTCTSSISPTILVRNTGSDTLRSGQFVSIMNGQHRSFVWSGSLAPFQHSIVNVSPPGNLVDGSNIFEVKLDTLLNGISDTSKTGRIDTIEYASQGVLLPLSEGFEEMNFPPPGWMLATAGDAISPWFQDTVRKTGAFSAGAFNTILVFDNKGRAEGLVSPVVDLRSLPSATLSFDLAYNYHRYTPPYFTATTDFSDTLDIMISTDCGATYTSLLRKAGAALATFAKPILNPLSLSADFIVPADSNWRHYSIDLSKFASAPEAMIKFNYISGLGGSIYIDNVEFSGPLAVEMPSPVSYRVFPNPATDRVTVVGDPSSPVQIAVLDITGRQSLSGEGMTDGSGEFVLDTRGLPAGVYLLRTSISQNIRTEKLFIRH